VKEMLFKSNRGMYFNKQRRSFIGFALIITTIIFLLVFVLVEKNLEPTILAIAEQRTHNIAVNYINKAVTKKIVNKVEYEDLVKIHKDDRGRIVLMQPNIIKIDKLQSETASEVNNSLSNLPNEKIAIPLGQVLGSQLLGSYGPKIHVTLVPLGTVQVTPINQFKEAGINQTRHMLSLKIESTIKIVIPLVSSDVKVNTEILIADNIILGEVPNEYTRINLDREIDKSLYKIDK
jgi:sporulation protein YunB